MYSFLLSLTTLLSLLQTTTTHPTSCKPPSPFNWTTTRSTGVNLGGWLVQESTIDTNFWLTHAPNASDEWTLCKTLGRRCGPVLEHRYATFITTPDIDTLATAGVSILRIPTTYAAWIDLPGSELYSGRQQVYLRKITEYAIRRYNMHIIIDVHSLPGGLNGLTIGEATGHWGWFHNETAWNHSMDIMDQVLAFISLSSSPGSFTLEPMNEPADRNGDEDLTMAVFGTPEALSESGAAYVLSFWQALLARVQKSGLNVPLMFQSFKLPDYWVGEFPRGSNIVFDVHNYYFEGRNTSSENLPGFILSDAQTKSGDGSFPVFVGEWSIQVAYNNSFALRKRNLNVGLEAWEEYTQGSCYWTAKFEGNGTIDGEGSQKDYWSFERFIKAGFLL
ncbi:glycoside hydrolase superfamily [Aspergillus pseudoustus]|uniref:glucan 1,3-beta-glucosidase n=1 Tax=Aspergillus pseudoustus TaxID=1810923 RepID=A0ABR4J7X8_9EURO